MKICLCSLILLWSAWVTSDPVKVSMKDILASVSQDEQWRLSQQTLDWLDKQNYQNPLLQKLEIRLGSNDFSLTRQQYGIRVSPNAFGQSKYQRQYQRAQSSVLQAEAQQYWNEALLQRYETIAQYHYAQQLSQASQSLDSLLQAQEEALRLMLREGLSVKIKEVVENEQDRQAIQLDLRQYQHAQEQARGRIRQFLPSNQEWELELQGFIPIPKIEQVVAGIRSEVLNTPLPETQIRFAQKSLLQSELDLLQVRNREYISFFQFGYERAPKTPTLDDDLFMRLGLNIPLNNTNRMKNNELMLELQEIDTKSAIATTEHQKELDLQLLQVKQLIQEYKLLEEQEKKNLAVSILEDPSLRAQVSVSDLLDLHLLRKKKQLSRLKLAQELTLEYLQLLYLNGKLVQKPLLNYLSVQLEPW
jgi:hypothetical protein